MAPTASDPKTFQEPSFDQRRNFVLGGCATLVGALVAAIPLLSGLWMFFQPLRRRNREDGVKVTLANLSQIPDDGIPRRFPVVAERVDAWTLHPKTTIGSVYLYREPGQAQPVAFSATCPHLGCMVDFKQGSRRFQCPCHNSFFERDGARVDPEHCPSPRDLDELEVTVDSGTEQVAVRFQKFRSGISEQIPES